ncbi:MAG: ribonuclease HII [Candidatus Paceibacterota bacterium]
MVRTKAYKYIIGADEAGRGPLAGPVAVACVKMVASLYDEEALFSRFAYLNDSKKVTPKRREVLYEEIKKAQKEKILSVALFFTSNKEIDKRGIMKATHAALHRGLFKCTNNPEDAHVLLDGTLTAPDVFVRQKTIIHGDEKEPLIMLASIVAKVSRDRAMFALAQEYPHYGFEKHKGYGTKEHTRALYRYGPCPAHRISFLSRILK